MSGDVATREAWTCPPVGVEVVTPPVDDSILTPARLRAQVSQTLTDDDLLLLDQALAAQALIETSLGRPLLAQTRRAWFDRPIGVELRLSEPATAITAIAAYDAADVEVPVAATVYQADTVAQPARVRLRAGQAWPSAVRAVQALSVTYTAGWDAVDVPLAIQHAIALLVAHWYRNREAVAMGAGNSLAELPLGVDALLRRYRVALGIG